MEFCHNVKPVRQPNPRVNPGGDCFACSVLAMMQYLFPEQELTMEYIHKVFTVKAHGGSDIFCNSWNGYDGVFHRLAYGDDELGLDKRFEIEKRRFLPPVNYENFDHHNFAWGGSVGNYSDYFWMVDAFVRADYILLVEVDYLGRGPMIEQDGKLVKNNTNHVILIDGTRRYWPNSIDERCHTQQIEFHIVDSNIRHKTNEYWLSAKSLVEDYGASGMWMVRKSKEYHLADTPHNTDGKEVVCKNATIVVS